VLTNLADLGGQAIQSEDQMIDKTLSGRATTKREAAYLSSLILNLNDLQKDLKGIWLQESLPRSTPLPTLRIWDRAFSHLSFRQHNSNHSMTWSKWCV